MADLGIARMVYGMRAGPHQSCWCNLGMGTPGYMSPEMEAIFNGDVACGQVR